MDDSTQDLAPVRAGDILAGKYKVERVLGAGGMGVVVAARHVQLDQQVALKFLLAQSLTNPKVVARFEREARAVVKLRGAHVARVIDVGTLDTGAPYIVMEFLEGQDLGQLIDARGQLPVAEAVDYMLQTCEALAEAHSHGIIHRDLKPQNLFVTRGVDGRNLLKVLDFGISKLEGVAENLSLTHTTEVVGSPNYMSPEQLRAARLADVRSDIWSLGVIFYELLTGGMPFNAETLAHLCAMVIAEPPRPIRELLPSIAPDLEAIVNRCLEKDPAKRYQSVAELAAALEPFADAMQSTTAQRIAAVASSGSYPSLPSSAKLVVNERSHNTSIGWGQTEVAATKKSLAPIFAAVAVGLLVVGGGSWLALRSKGPTPASSSDVVTSTTPIPSTTSSAPETTSASATPSAAPSESAMATASVTPTTSASAKPPKPAGTTKTTKPVKPKPGGGIDDLPSERN